MQLDLISTEPSPIEPTSVEGLLSFGPLALLFLAAIAILVYFFAFFRNRSRRNSRDNHTKNNDSRVR